MRASTCSHCGRHFRGIRYVPTHGCPGTWTPRAPSSSVGLRPWRSKAANAASAHGRALSRRAVALRYRLVP